MLVWIHGSGVTSFVPQKFDQFAIGSAKEGHAQLRGDPRFEKNRRLPRAKVETLISRIVTNHRIFALIRVG